MYFCKVKQLTTKLLLMKRYFKSLILIVMTVFLVTFSSCSTFFIGNSNIEPVVFVKPVYRDSASITSYVGGKFNRSEFMNPYSDMHTNYFGQLNWSQTQTEKYFNLSYGAFGYYGQITLNQYESSEPFDITNKGYFGGGVSADIQLNLPFENVNIRPIGIRGSLLYEDGEFAKYKKQNLEAIGFFPDKIAMTFSQTAGIDFKLKRSSIGVNISVGSILTMPRSIIDMGYSTNVNYTASKFNIFIQNSGMLFMSNNDLIVGFNYRLP